MSAPFLDAQNQSIATGFAKKGIPAASKKGENMDNPITFILVVVGASIVVGFVLYFSGWLLIRNTERRRKQEEDSEK